MLPVSSVQNGAFQIAGVALSLPTVISAHGAGRILEVPLSVSELLGLQASASTLLEVQQSLGF